MQNRSHAPQKETKGPPLKKGNSFKVATLRASQVEGGGLLLTHSSLEVGGIRSLLIHGRRLAVWRLGVTATVTTRTVVAVGGTILNSFRKPRALSPILLSSKLRNTKKTHKGKLTIVCPPHELLPRSTTFLERAWMPGLSFSFMLQSSPTCPSRSTIAVGCSTDTEGNLQLLRVFLYSLS